MVRKVCQEWTFANYGLIFPTDIYPGIKYLRKKYNLEFMKTKFKGDTI